MRHRTRITHAPMFLALLASCGTTGSVRQAPGPDSMPDQVVEEPDEQRTFVPVSHERELRAGWIATVSNINWPSNPSLTAAEQQAELRALLDACADAGLNAVVFQVRPESDALYASSLEPWSRYLTGSQGVDPGWDPLDFIVEEGHARGLEVHAWFNPFRAKANANSQAAATHVSERFPEHAHRYGSLLWMDPGAPEVRDHLVAVISDVVQRYDIDGVHFDDYFYPYPNEDDFPDDATYTLYGSGQDRGDWRRANVNDVVRRVASEIADEKPWVRWGISPFGIYRPGQPPGITGLDQYGAIFADPVKWKEEGWVDYLAPQLYWPTTQTNQAFGSLVAWWPAQSGESYTFVGHYLSQLDSSSSWSVDEIREQVALTRAQRAQGARGSIWFHIGPLVENQLGIRDTFREEFYPRPALSPPVLAMQDTPVAAPDTEWTDAGLRLSHASARWWMVYRPEDAGWVPQEIISAAHSEIALAPGQWVVTAVGPHGIESEGVLVER